MIERDVADALEALDRALVHVCDLEERRAARIAGAERGWESLRAALAPRAAELAYAIDAEHVPLCPASGPAAMVQARRALGLTALEVDALIVLLAPHLEPRYARVYAALQDDTALGFTIERLLHLVLARTPERARQLAASLAEGSRLIEAGLIVPGAGPHPPQARPLDLASDARDAIVDLPPPRSVAGLALAWSPARGAPERGTLAVVHGAGERLERAHDVAGEVSTVLVRLAAVDREAIRAAWRVAALRGALPIFDAAALGGTDATAVAEQLVHLVRAIGGSAVVAARAAVPVAIAHHEAPAAPYRMRRAMWIDEAAARGAAIEERTAERLATNLRLDRSEVRDVLSASPDTELATLAATAHRLSRTPVRHAHRVPTGRSFDDLVVRDTTRAALDRLVHFTEERDRIAEERGLEARFRMQRGPIALFSGRSGTGKTLAAEVVAGRLGRPLYVVDLSRLVSKYIGETEKHIDEVLASGERAGAVLFFDEADALFASRTEVSTSNDRFANLEVGYLLQRIEYHDGLVILATNLQHAIDEAFLRRFHARVEFPFPEADERRRIWDLMLPPTIERADVDLAEIARRHRLAGGDIRNAALKAILIADREARAIAQHDLERAVAIELYELGRLSRRDGASDDPGTRLRRLAETFEATLEDDLRRRFLKEVHVVHGSPTKETLAGKRPAVSIAMYRIAAGAEPGALRLGMILSAWSARPEEEIELLGVLLDILAAARLDHGGERIRLRVQQSNDFDLLHRFWSSHGHPVRASIAVDVELG